MRDRAGTNVYPSPRGSFSDCEPAQLRQDRLGSSATSYHYYPQAQVRCLSTSMHPPLALCIRLDGEHITPALCNVALLYQFPITLPSASREDMHEGRNASTNVPCARKRYVALLLVLTAYLTVVQSVRPCLQTQDSYSNAGPEPLQALRLPPVSHLVGCSVASTT